MTPRRHLPPAGPGLIVALQVCGASPQRKEARRWGKGSYDAMVVFDNRVFLWRRPKSFVFYIMEIDGIDFVRFVARLSLARHHCGHFCHSHPHFPRDLKESGDRRMIREAI